MEERTDIRDQSENKLSLIVFNNEFLYNQRRRSNFVELLNDLYLYTDEQFEVLKKDLEGQETA